MQSEVDKKGMENCHVYLLFGGWVVVGGLFLLLLPHLATLWCLEILLGIVIGVLVHLVKRII